MKKLLALLLMMAMVLSMCCSCKNPFLGSNRPDTSDEETEEREDDRDEETEGIDQTDDTTEETEESQPPTYEVSEKDTDGDGLYDHAEAVFKTDINLADTDGDGFSDYDELKKYGTDPLTADTDGNGVNDSDDDHDQDGLSNSYEMSVGLDPNAADSDFDGVHDGDELQVYHSDALLKDTDGDGASDGWEVTNGFDPITADNSFAFSVSSETDGLTAGVTVNVNGQTAESITVQQAHSSVLLDDRIPGALGPAYEFDAVGELGAVEIFFAPGDDVLLNEEVKPAIYCLNEEKQVFYEMETTVENGMVKTVSSHFSTYILLDKNVYEAYLQSTYDVDYTEDSGVDSNNDGISDYITKLMCEGVIRTGTGTLVFGEYTFEEIQANNDIDQDGILNGDEISCDYYLDIPEDVKEFNGHYYKVFDVGDFWLSARSYCESVGGYLCTVTSAEEQDFVVSLLGSGSKNVYWLGGIRADTSWEWVTGEEFLHTHWGPEEPNNMEGAENYLQIYAKAFRQKVTGDWNDASNVGAEYASDFYSVVNTGYICEWGSFTLNSRKYAFINSSPIHSDTDMDGFVDAVDVTPYSAGHFSDLSHYIQYKYNGTPSATLVVDQPAYGSNLAVTEQYRVGHTFILLSDGKGEVICVGFYPAEWEGSKYDNYIEYTLANIYTRGYESTGGCISDDSSHGWDVAYSKEITAEQLDKILKYVEDNKNREYNLQSYNCTTFAVQALEAGDFKVTQYVHKTLWALPLQFAPATLTIFYPFGYSPGQAGYDLMVNTSEFIGKEEIQLKDGTKAEGVCDLVLTTGN